MEQLLPNLNIEELKAKADEAAKKGALQAIEEYYTGYNSPFKKKVAEILNEQQFAGNFELPDVIGLINTSMSAEIDKLANEAVAKSFIPMVSRFLTRANSEMKFSEILEEIINDTFHQDPDDYHVEVEEDEKHKWLNIKLRVEDREYEITAHFEYGSEKEGQKKYSILSLPWERSSSAYNRNMRLKVGDNATLEIPFTSNILQDKVISLIAKLVLAKTKIIFDTDEFTDDMFPEKCHCD